MLFAKQFLKNGMITVGWQLNDVEIFVRAAQTNSFTQASRLLSIPTSTVSRRIGQLETDLNLRLFERNSRNMRLTEAGKQLLNECHASINHINQGVNQVLKRSENYTGCIKISAPTFIGKYLLGAWLLEYQTKHPYLKVELNLDDKNEALIEKQFDFAIRIGPLKDSSLIARLMTTTQLIFCASKKYISQHGKPHSIEQLAQHYFVRMTSLPEKLSITYESEELTLSLPEQTNQFFSNDISLIKQACLNGVGIAILPKLIVQDALSDQSLLSLLDVYQIKPTREVYVVFPSKSNMSPSVKDCIDFIQEKFMMF